MLLRVQGLKHVFAKAGDGVGEKNLGFPRRGHSVNTHMKAQKYN